MAKRMVDREAIAKLVERLFTPGGTEGKVHRLVLTTLSNGNLGGWAEQPMVDFICRELGIKDAPKPKPTKARGK